MEFRKRIIGYEGLYDIDRIGNIYSLARIWKNGRKRERILKPTTDYYGNQKINLYKNSKQSVFYIEKLVLEHFGVYYPNDSKCGDAAAAGIINF